MILDLTELEKETLLGWKVCRVCECSLLRDGKERMSYEESFLCGCETVVMSNVLFVRGRTAHAHLCVHIPRLGYLDESMLMSLGEETFCDEKRKKSAESSSCARRLKINKPTEIETLCKVRVIKQKCAQLQVCLNEIRLRELIDCNFFDLQNIGRSSDCTALRQ